MSARSRYLEAISPRGSNNNAAEQRDDEVVISPVSRQQKQTKQQQPNNNPSKLSSNGTAAAAAQASPSPFGLKRTSSVKSPSFVSNHRSGNANNLNAVINKEAPPPPPGLPVRRGSNNGGVKPNNKIHVDSSDSVAVSSTAAVDGDSNGSEQPKSTSPVRAKGEQWSPREDIPSGSVHKYRDMIWGSKPPKNVGPPKPESPVANAVKHLEALYQNKGTKSPGRSASSPAASAGSAAAGASQSRKSLTSTSNATASTTFYKRTGPPPPLSPNEISATSTSSPLRHNSKAPTPPSRIPLRQQPRGVGGGYSSPVVNNKSITTTTPLQQRMGQQLNISPLDTSFQNEITANNNTTTTAAASEPASSNNNYYQQQHTPDQKEGITTITAFKRQYHKVGIIFTRQSSTSPDVAIIARILPDSIFAKHNDYALVNGGGGLEGSEVIAVNGIPVRNPKHAAELVAKATEEVRLAIIIRKRDDNDKNVISNNDGMTVKGGDLDNDDEGEKKQSRQKEAGGLRHQHPQTQSIHHRDHHQTFVTARSPPQQQSSMDEDSTSYSINTEGPPEEKQQQVVGGVSGGYYGNTTEATDQLPVYSESVNDADEPPQQQQQQRELFVVRRGSLKQQMQPTQQQQQKQEKGKDSAAAAAAAKKSKEVADMRRMVAQAMLMSQEMVHDPAVDDIDVGVNSISIEDDDDEWHTLSTTGSKTAFIMKKTEMMTGVPPLQSSPSKDLAERRRQAAFDMYNSQEMVGDNVNDAALGIVDVVSGMNKETISGAGGGVGKMQTASMPLKDVGRVNSFGSSSVASKARTDVTTESMATQRMGTSPTNKSSSRKGEGEEEMPFKFEEEQYERNAAALASAMIGPATKEQRRVKQEPKEMTMTFENTVPGASVEIQRGAGKEKDDSVSAAVSRSAVSTSSPSKWSPGRRSLFGVNSQKKSSKMLEGVKKILKPQKFIKSKAGDKGILLEDSPEESGMDTLLHEPNSLPATATAATASTAEPTATEEQVVDQTDDPFADFFKDPFSNLPFVDSANGDPFGFPETEPPSHGDTNAFFSLTADSWGEPSRLPDITASESSDALSHGEMSEITNPTFFSKKTNKKEAKPGDLTESKGNNSSENKRFFAAGHDMIYKQSSLAGDSPISYWDPSAEDLPSGKTESIPSRESERDGKAVSMLMAKSRIMSKYALKHGKNRKDATATDFLEPAPQAKLKSLIKLSPQQSNEAKSPDIQSTGRGHGKQGALNDLALAREQAIARQREIDCAATKAKQAGVIPPYTSKVHRGRSGRSSPHRLDNSALSMSNSKPNAKSNYARLKKKVSPSVVDNPAYYSVEKNLAKIKDPIQRAGVRLLWAAAIPIQTLARRFLARQYAIKRMCAVLTIQSFVRRWNAERNLEIAVWSAIQIQAAFRGWFARDSLEDNHYCATQIQRITRGYLATLHVFEDLYSITIVQSVVRRFLAINLAVDRLSSIIAIQAWYRGCRAREVAGERLYSAIAIQSAWRRYVCQMTYQFDAIDIIIVQSIVRRKQAIQLRKKIAAAVRIQALARTFFAKNEVAKQRTMNDLLKRHTSAVKIQSCWRSYSAQVSMLTTIVNIIVIQSVWRRRSVEKIYKPHLNRIMLARQRKRNNAATKIQSAWRGFFIFSDYTILCYDRQEAATRIQALVRGCQERSWLAFQKECAAIIQASVRGYLLRKECHNERMISVLIAAAATSLRTRNAARCVQRWWVEEMSKRKEKKAALVIERFFIYVKREVEKEIKAIKKKKRQRKKMKKYMQSDDWILENAWQGLEPATSSTSRKATVAVEGTPYDHGQQYDNRCVRAGMPTPSGGGRLIGPMPQAAAYSSQSINDPPQSIQMSDSIRINDSIQQQHGYRGPMPQAVAHSTQLDPPQSTQMSDSIRMNDSIRQQHGYRGHRYDRTDDELDTSLDAAFEQACYAYSQSGNNNHYEQRQTSRWYEGRRYN